MRIKELQKKLHNNTAFIVSDPTNRFYLSGLHSSAGSIVITENTACLLIDFRYFEKAKQTVKSMDVRLCRNLFKDIKDILQSQSIKNVILETATTTIEHCNSFKAKLSEFEILNDSVLSDTLNNLRQIKDKEEISFIKASQKITDSAFSHILNLIKEGVTEREIALELEFFMRKNGSEGVAFSTIAVSGKNSSLPHGVPTEKPLQKGDFLTMDFGAIVNGYCSDMTRTVAIGYVTDEQRKIYDTVLKAQFSAIEKITPRVPCCEIDKTARDIIANEGYGEFFGHSLGHSVGLNVHEGPSCNTMDNTPLREGMTMTVEPGIYLPDKFGVRIEDMVIVTEKACDNITASPKELIIL